MARSGRFDDLAAGAGGARIVALVVRRREAQP
jgi:hypothetical protein